MARVPALGAGCRRFKSCHLDQKTHTAAFAGGAFFVYTGLEDVAPNFACRLAAGENLGKTSGGGFDSKRKALSPRPRTADTFGIWLFCLWKAAN